ncbi:Hypothetical predicted protein [Olea europaea subsp. europaea]|uniref:Uncharacterized protein n=1 Tax=Olea europaea subsp. europaea TaxID=158383 RepID=A0A8S0S9H5_OLEEU|nr:Hypothetical predicted protein [Olea europaea subsp. europaea]
MEDEDDTLYEQNVINGIKMGIAGHDQVQDERGEGNDMEVDDLEYPMGELLSQCSSDDDGGFRFPQFSVEADDKMVAIGGKGSSSVGNTTRQSSFCFMPTPMVTHEVGRDCTAPGPAVTMPISDEHEAGQPVEDTVATVEVDFEEMVD